MIINTEFVFKNLKITTKCLNKEAFIVRNIDLTGL